MDFLHQPKCRYPNIKTKIHSRVHEWIVGWNFCTFILIIRKIMLSIYTLQRKLVFKDDKKLLGLNNYNIVELSRKVRTIRDVACLQEHIICMLN